MAVGKIRRGSDFGKLCHYALNPDKTVKPEIIGGNISSENPIAIAAEFRSLAALNPRVKMPVKHFIIGFAPEDGEVSKALKTSLAAEYIERMGHGSSQYLVVNHSRSDHDHSHDHIHIIANAVDTQGKWVDDSFNWKRSQVILRDLESRYRLAPIASSWDKNRDRSKSTRRDRRIERLLAKGIEPTEIDRISVEIQAKIERAAIGANTMTEFCARLQSLGIEPLPRIAKTGRVQGMSYRQGDVVLRGCDLNNASLPRLQSVRAIQYDLGRDLVSLQAIGRGERLQVSDEFVKQSQPKAVSIPVETSSRAVSIPVEGGKPHTERGEGLSR